MCGRKAACSSVLHHLSIMENTRIILDVMSFIFIYFYIYRISQNTDIVYSFPRCHVTPPLKEMFDYRPKFVSLNAFKSFSTLPACSPGWINNKHFIIFKIRFSFVVLKQYNFNFVLNYKKI